MALPTTYAAKSGLPWWGLIIALLFSWMFIPIIGTVSTVFSLEMRVTLKQGIIIVVRYYWICTKHRKYGSSAKSYQSNVFLYVLTTPPRC